MIIYLIIGRIIKSYRMFINENFSATRNLLRYLQKKSIKIKLLAK